MALLARNVASPGRARLIGEAPDIEFGVMADDHHQGDGKGQQQEVAEQFALEEGRAEHEDAQQQEQRIDGSGHDLITLG